MDQNIINITYQEGKGRMTVALDKFFPTDATRLRKLLKIISEDYEHRDEHRAAVVQHCVHRASRLLDSREDLFNRAAEYHTKATKLQPEIDRLTQQVSAMQEYVKTYCKRGKGQEYRQQLKGLRAQLKNAKEQQRCARALCREYQRRIVSAEKDAGRLKKNAEAADYGK